MPYPVFKLQPSPRHCHVSVEQVGVTHSQAAFCSSTLSKGVQDTVTTNTCMAWKALLLFHDHYEGVFKLLCISLLDLISHQLSHTDTYPPPPLETMTSFLTLQEGMGLLSS